MSIIMSITGYQQNHRHLKPRSGNRQLAKLPMGVSISSPQYKYFSKDAAAKLPYRTDLQKVMCKHVTKGSCMLFSITVGLSGNIQPSCISLPLKKQLHSLFLTDKKISLQKIKKKKKIPLRSLV